MKGNKELITVLNSLLADELTAINQHMVHSEICENWAYAKLFLAIHGQAMDEMHQTEWLIERNNFFEKASTVSKLNPFRIGLSESEMIPKDFKGDLNAVNSYNSTIKLANELYDQSTADLLTTIPNTELVQENWNEIQRSQIDQTGLDNFQIN